MIGFLRGRVIEKRRGEAWIECGGVGYRIRVGEKIYESMTLEQEAALFIHTAVREDAIELYGFLDYQTLALFEMFISVSGIGPKTASVIVGTKKREEVERAVQEADVAFFQKVPGIGKKGAQRIIVDLKGKMPSLKELDLSESEGEDEVLEALVSFGFKKVHAQEVVGKLDASLSVEERIREGLKRLGR
jgi:holliday junction DNA helicase RuvA